MSKCIRHWVPQRPTWALPEEPIPNRFVQLEKKGIDLLTEGENVAEETTTKCRRRRIEINSIETLNGETPRSGPKKFPQIVQL